MCLDVFRWVFTELPKPPECSLCFGEFVFVSSRTTMLLIVDAIAVAHGQHRRIGVIGHTGDTPNG